MRFGASRAIAKLGPRVNLWSAIVPWRTAGTAPGKHANKQESAPCKDGACSRLSIAAASLPLPDTLWGARHSLESEAQGAELVVDLLERHAAEEFMQLV